jgi:hypothetical protein
VLLGTGATIFVIVSPGNTSFNTLGTLVILGAVATLGSIPFFISAAHIKHKAMSASAFLEIDRAPSFQQKLTTFHTYPAIGFKIHL